MTTADDRDEISALLYSYAFLIDRGDFEGMADLLADAAVSFEGHSLVCRGRDQVLGLYRSTTRRYSDDCTPKTQHVVSNVLIEFNDHQEGAARMAAGSRSYFTVFQAVPGALALQPVAAGRYQDRFARNDGTWGFTSRHVAMDMAGELGLHLLGPLGT